MIKHLPGGRFSHGGNAYDTNIGGCGEAFYVYDAMTGEEVVVVPYEDDHSHWYVVDAALTTIQFRKMVAQQRVTEQEGVTA